MHQKIGNFSLADFSDLPIKSGLTISIWRLL